MHCIECLVNYFSLIYEPVFGNVKIFLYFHFYRTNCVLICELNCVVFAVVSIPDPNTILEQINI